MKNIVGPFQVVPYANITGTVTSAVTDARRVDNVVYQVVSALVTGTLTVQGSVDYQFSAPSAVFQDVTATEYIGKGNWVNLTASSFTGSAGSTLALNQTAYPFLRAVVAATTSGSGSIWVSGKSIGA